MIDFEIRAPPIFIAAFEAGRREGAWLTAVCPICGKSPKERKLRAGIYMGKPWWGCMKNHCERTYKAEQAEKYARMRMQSQRGTAEYEARLKHDAVTLFSEAAPVRVGESVHRYLVDTRGLVLRGGVAPSDLRAKRCFNRELKERQIGTYPLAMIAAVRDVAGVIIAVHRTYLFEHDDGRVVKLNDDSVPERLRVQEAKKSMASTLGGAIRLGVDSDEIGIGEGIETALGLAQGTGLVCWSALSSAGMAALLLPKHIKRVVIGPDIGDKKRSGIKAAHALHNRLISEARRSGRPLRIEILNPPNGCNDWNDKPRAK